MMNIRRRFREKAKRTHAHQWGSTQRVRWAPIREGSRLNLLSLFRLIYILSILLAIHHGRGTLC